MSNLSKEFDKVFKDLRTDPYASEAETDALIKPDPRGPAEKRLHTMMDERGAWEQGAESFSVLRDIALELLTEQIKSSTNDRRTKACLMACEGVSTEDLEAVMVNTGPLLKNKLAEVDLLRATNANLRARPAPVTLISSERHIALREAFAINSADLYFEANPTHDNDVGRMLFERGFARGFDSHERAIETAKKGQQ
jgi:hypothetical protein